MIKKILPVGLMITFVQLSSHGACNHSVVCKHEPTPSRKLHKVEAAFEVQFSSPIEFKTKQQGDEIEITIEKAENMFFRNTVNYYNALIMGAYSVGQASYRGENPRSFNQVLSRLRNDSVGFSTEEKLLILSEAGSRLAKGYDYSLTNQKSNEDLFRNSQNYGNQGGICGDIHQYLASMATAMGFEQVGTHTLKWFKVEDEGRGHIVSHFRDPKTGKYYIQNYGSLVSTNARDLATAIDVSTKIHGPLTNLTMIEGRPGVYHAYTPEVARWIYGQMDRLLGDKSDRSKIIIEAGDDSQFFGLKVTSSSPIGQISGFILSKQEMTEAGKYSVSVLGVELLQNGEMQSSSGMALGYEVKARVGGLNIQTPNYNPGASFDKYDYFTGYIEGGVTGYARLNKTTGEIELSAQNLDAHLKEGALPLAHIKLRMRQDVGLDTKIEVERSLVNSRKNHESISHTVVVEADRFSILIDAREQNKEKAYLKFQGDYYFLEGIDARSAQAVRAQLAGVLPERLLRGQLQVVFDVSRILSNPKNDALYRYFDQNTAVALRVSWEKQIQRNTTVGVSTEVRNQRPYPLFQQTQNSLNSSRQGREQKWMAYVRIVF